jgi:hypothetical protein
VVGAINSQSLTREREKEEGIERKEGSKEDEYG